MPGILAIIDKDGTLTDTVSGHQFPQSPTDQLLLPGVANRIAELKEMGATIVIASNQGGVAAGHKTLDDAIREMQYVLKLLPQVDYAFFCPDFDGLQCYYVHQSNIDAPPEIAGWEAHRANVGASLIGTFRKRTDGHLGSGMLHAAMLIYPMLSQVVMVGDRPEDQQAAAQAGITFVDAEAWRSGQVSVFPEGAIV